MFNIFKKKADGIKIIDKILMTQAAKWKALADQWKKNNDLILVFWFDETRRQAENAFSNESISSAELFLTREINTAQIANKQLLFAEHYPLAQKEKDLFEKLQLSEVQVWSAMDEPLFKQFGSDKIIQMMKQFGMKEDQVIEHNMISKAIHNAQEKIEKKVTTEHLSNSQEDWMKKNWADS